MARKRHHVVSRGYLRFFADGERILLVDKKERTIKEVGTRDTFVETRFNSWKDGTEWNDELEDQWEAVENWVLPNLRVLLERHGGDEQRHAAKVLAAIHVARSYAVRRLQHNISEQIVETAGDRYSSDPEFISEYAREFGHDPVVGEIKEYLADNWQRETMSGLFILQRTVKAYEFALRHFEPLQVQFFYSNSKMGFATGDTPIIVGDAGLLRVGIGQGLALGDAARIWMPLTSGCLMCLWPAGYEMPGDSLLPPFEVQAVNRVTWRAADRFVVCHPNQDPTRTLMLSSDYSTGQTYPHE